MKRALLVATLLALLGAGAVASTPLAVQAATRSPTPGSHCLVTKVVLHGSHAPQTICLRAQPTPGKAPTTSQDDNCTDDLILYQDANEGGGQICFSGQGHVNLTDFSLWWWCGMCSSWNDQVSSFQTGMTYGHFAWDINDGGTHYSFPTHDNVPWIGRTWNDQISSVTIDGSYW